MKKEVYKSTDPIFIPTIVRIDKLVSTDPHTERKEFIEGKNFIKFFVPTVQQFAYTWQNPLIDGKEYANAEKEHRPLFVFRSEDLRKTSICENRELKETVIRPANKAELKNVLEPIQTILGAKGAEHKARLGWYKFKMFFARIFNKA